MTPIGQQAPRVEACLALRAAGWLQEMAPEYPQASYYRARYYDSNPGRFISDDPVRFLGGINFYTYSANSPTNFNDPFGFEPQGCTDCQGRPKQGAQAGKACCGNEAPMSNSAAPPYPDTYTYQGVSANDMFKNGGNGPWGNIVRGCLICMYRHGVDPRTAHHFCYANGWKRTSNWQTFTGLVSAVGEAFAWSTGNFWNKAGPMGGSLGPQGW